MNLSDENATFIVIINQEKEYSIWLRDRELPLGWEAVGKQGTRDKCRDYLIEVGASFQEETENTIYVVIINQEEEYSIRPAYHGLPLGWKAANKQGTRDECLDYIQEVWTDMRPLSVRKKMEEEARKKEEEAENAND